MGESWPRSQVQTERSEICTLDRGQDSPDRGKNLKKFNSFNVTRLY